MSNPVNVDRELRVALVEGSSRTLFTRHKTALQIVLETSLDMES